MDDLMDYLAVDEDDRIIITSRDTVDSAVEKVLSVCTSKDTHQFFRDLAERLMVELY